MANDPLSLSGAVEIIAHRGFSARAPENTIAALTLALEEGATAVEFDLRTSGDGNPVLMHDKTLSRTTNGIGKVEELSLGELTKLDAGSWFNSTFEGERVPSLAEALECLKVQVKTIFAELKGESTTQNLRNVVSITRAAGLLDKTVFIAKDWSLLDELRRHAPEALVGPIVERREQTHEAFTRVTDDPRALLDFDARILLKDPDIARYAKRNGVEIAVWTVDNIGDADVLLEFGVRRITTNQVGRMLAWASTL
ncbi:MAG TPA: glycerophosphodiester phosphodiesterase [Gemmatimonadetes bacterium]|jgi:glycerophosphoryl diester phosphodiesterase|nr:glycerophosphodiester phosphodiesterase [Gemmatimonadota bacterium]|tara:strand:- start:821 stop:1582 length:762 start_codon:yes stop_codon:yes gene_type:complete